MLPEPPTVIATLTKVADGASQRRLAGGRASSKRVASLGPRTILCGLSSLAF